MQNGSGEGDVTVSSIIVQEPDNMEAIETLVASAVMIEREIAICDAVASQTQAERESLPGQT